MTEQQPYSVLKVYEGFELRSYPAHVLAQVTVVGDFMSAGSMAFGPLVRYISGNNIAMTAPVVQEPLAGNSHLISFVMPAGMDVKSLPIPRDSRVTTLHVPESRVAARKFGGGWNEDKFESQGRELLAAVQAANLKTTGNLYWARFDPPWKPGFLKRNEVLIAVAS
jgi:hypothetical protein